MVVGQRHGNSGERDGVLERKKVEGMDGVEERSRSEKHDLISIYFVVVG
jgi:hypothetical protein